MDVVTAREMARVERMSIEEGASSEGYMLRAGRGIAAHVHAFVERENRRKEIVLLAGRGNNGGDGYVAGESLLQKGYRVRAYSLFPEGSWSPLCKKWKRAYVAAGGVIQHVHSIRDSLDFFQKGVILDAILGTGFRGELEGPLSEVIAQVNQSGIPVLSIDLPSGVDGNSGVVNGTAIRAKETLFLGAPKLGCFLGRGYEFVGAWRRVDFGMSSRYLEKMETAAHLIQNFPRNILPRPSRIQHKYLAGYVLAIGGSPGMSGAPILAGLAAYRSGAGIVRLFHPKGMEGEFVTAPYELISAPYSVEDPSPIWREARRAGACLIGPGMGRGNAVFLRSLIAQLHLPIVIDADGLFPLRGCFEEIKGDCILTPHRGEMLRLLEKKACPDGEILPLCQRFCEANRVTLVLKGAPTFLFHPNTPPSIIARGDPGMATAGTGDVLAGMIAALLSKGMDCREAALLAVFLHGLAGEIAAAKGSSYTIMATDLIGALPEAFRTVSST